MTRARLTFPEGDPIEFSLEDVVAFGPEIHGFRAWLGAVFASADGRWIIRIGEDEVLGFRRDELKRVRATPVGAELTLGDDEAVPVREADVTSYGPEPQGVRAWLDHAWSAVRPAVIEGAIVYGPPRGAEATFVRADTWIGGSVCAVADGTIP